MTVSGIEQLAERKRKVLKHKPNDETLRQIRRRATEPALEEHNRTVSSLQQLTTEEEHLLRTKPHELNEEGKKRRRALKRKLLRNNMGSNKKSRELEE